MYSPNVSIGLPVYNGSKYIEEAINSMLSQSYTDFELIISDNASTDGTEKICKYYENIDYRVRFYRNRSNIGSAKNFNKAFRLAKGKYFKWAAHDDICSKNFVKSSVQFLENDASIVLCSPEAKAIDKNGQILKGYMNKYEKLKNTNSRVPYKRFHDIACRRHGCYQIFGLIRASALFKSSLISNFIGSDRVLLSEIALKGRFYNVPEMIHFRRHSEQYCALNADKDRRAWFSPNMNAANDDKYARQFAEYTRVIRRAPLKFHERIFCFFVMVDWLRRKRRHFAKFLSLTPKTVTQAG